jgi:hypothetical protein
MRLFVFSNAVLGVIAAAACQTTQAAPMTLLPSKMASNAQAAHITAVRYYHHYPHRYWRRGYPLAAYWNYYRTDWPGRGASVESTR